MTCPFCRIAAGETDAVVLYEDGDIVAFLDIAPIRPGHTQIVPRRHVETFEQLPPELAARMMMLAQQLARRMKAVYGVERVAFLFTGGDVPHAHAHVVPMHAKTDITSARYVVEPAELSLSSEHLLVDRAMLLRVREELAFSVASTRPQ
ncbi:MAG TPA: HIT family protein [Longimicrobiales bacterium]